jgi:hypothetical protein
MMNCTSIKQASDEASEIKYLGGAIFAHKGAETVIRDIKDRELPLCHMGHVDVVGGGANVFIFAVGEDVNANDVGLGVTVLSSLGCADICNFARAAIDDNVTTFANKTRLHGKRGGGTGIGGVDGEVLLLIRHGAKAVTETLA